MRYAFYANPFASVGLDETLAVYDGSDYELYLQLLEENEDRGDALVIRYEVAERDYIELRHPVSHFHVGLHEGRWPVDKILSPLAFTMLIAKLFYPSAWSETHDEEFAEAKRRCEFLAPSMFSDRERQHLYIT
jgi:hypothetical protein